MLKLQKLFISVFLLFVNGCTYIDVRQLGYFVVGNLHQYQCQKAMEDRCAESSFAEYQRQRQEVSK